ncbi:MAG: DNA primase, partial [Chloroflexota bacterium]
MPESIAEEIKARLDIADIVSERVLLKKAGKSLKGLCPFHVEKTPSFVVFPETGSWHCFGCGEGGDIFTFVMRSQNVDFAEALAILAARAGVELRSSERGQQPDGGVEKLYAANEAAAAHFRSMLASPAGARAREYLRRRQISAESIADFEIGFAPDSGAGLAHHLLQLGFSREEILQAGLAGENESGALYDRFRSRVIFPIRDNAGRLVGFGGRSLSNDAQPKYLNTPQTALFDKGGCLYAVDKAKKEIRQTGRAVIVEGYMDALMAHQHGYRNVVASLGTAVTGRQLSQLKRW